MNSTEHRIKGLVYVITVVGLHMALTRGSFLPACIITLTAKEIIHLRENWYFKLKMVGITY
jgi:hypothetical protein